MPRGQAWDELPRPYPYAKPIDSISQVLNDAKEGSTAVPQVEMVEKRDMYRDLEQVGRRVLFGSVCGTMIGATFAIVEILRDVKAVTAKKTVALAKVGRYSGIFALYFGTYHGMRKVLKLTVPLSPEGNLLTAGALCLTPMVFHRVSRPLAPYGALLVAIDAINGIDHIEQLFKEKSKEKMSSGKKI